LLRSPRGTSVRFLTFGVVTPRTTRPFARLAGMITGAHILFYSKDPEADARRLLADLCGGEFDRGSASLIELNAELPHDLTPADNLVCIELGEFVTRRRARFESERLDPTCKAGGLHDLHQLAIEPV